MPKNKLAGTGKKNSYKGMSDAAIARKRKYDLEFSRKPAQVQRRVEANRANRKAQREGKARVGDNLDMSHTKSGKLVLEHQSKNRARNGRNGRSTLK